MIHFYTRHEYRSDLKCPACGSTTILTIWPYSKFKHGKCLDCKEKTEVWVFEQTYEKNRQKETDVDKDWIHERLSNSF